MKYKFILRIHLLAVFFCAALVMLAFETLKELYFKGSLTPWESHTITIFMTATLALAASFFIQKWIEKIHNRIHEELEIKVQERTRQLEQAIRGKDEFLAVIKQKESMLLEQLDELRRWHDITSGREGRILELKHEVNEILGRVGQPPRYPSAESQDQTKE